LASGKQTPPKNKRSKLVQGYIQGSKFSGI